MHGPHRVPHGRRNQCSGASTRTKSTALAASNTSMIPSASQARIIEPNLCKAYGTDFKKLNACVRRPTCDDYIEYMHLSHYKDRSSGLCYKALPYFHMSSGCVLLSTVVVLNLAQFLLNPEEEDLEDEGFGV
uniref:Uncharacterized protein n=1 Tax=Oryza sativa subsp. japonica TaxID=39947 RepID=Q6YS84_ORYSJ|nr:hypothetical protein [Oryza sativa Japonica Group]BAD31772.1 hypothetical protein [Oryza sativa Japonica Group]